MTEISSRMFQFKTSNLLKYVGLVCILSCCLPIALTAQSFSTREQAFQYQFEDILSGELADTLKLQFFVDRLNDLSAKGSTLPIEYAQKGIALAQITGNPKWKGLIQIELGWIYQRLNKIALAEEQYLSLIHISEPTRPY